MTGGAPADSELDLSSRLDYLEVAERRGATRTLRKPFELEELISAIEEVLSAT